MEYLIFSLVGCFSALQITSALSSRGEIQIFENTRLTIILSLFLLILSFIWFFSIRDRNVQTFLEGGQISIIFGIGAILSLIVTKIIKQYGFNRD